MARCRPSPPAPSSFTSTACRLSHRVRFPASHHGGRSLPARRTAPAAVSSSVFAAARPRPTVTSWHTHWRPAFAAAAATGVAILLVGRFAPIAPSGPVRPRHPPGRTLSHRGNRARGSDHSDEQLLPDSGADTVVDLLAEDSPAPRHCPGLPLPRPHPAGRDFAGDPPGLIALPPRSLPRRRPRLPNHASGVVRRDSLRWRSWGSPTPNLMMEWRSARNASP